MEVAPAATRGSSAAPASRSSTCRFAHGGRAGQAGALHAQQLQNATTAVAALLSSLLALDDSLVQHRSETLLMHPTNGLVAVIMSELSNPRPAGRRGGTTTS